MERRMGLWRDTGGTIDFSTFQKLQITYEIKENLYDSQKEFYTDVFHGFN